MTSTPALARPTFWQYGWQTVGFGVLYVVVTFLAAYAGFAHLSTRLVIAIVSAIVVLVGLVVGYTIAARLGRQKLESLALVAPGDFVFRFTSSLSLGNLFPDPETRKPLESNLANGFGASADAEGVSVWFGPEPRLVASLGWKSVIDIQRDKVTAGQLNYPSVALSYLGDDGSTRKLQLVKASVEPLAVRSRVEVDWIVQQLNGIRRASGAA